jgi:hypothetical protein
MKTRLATKIALKLRVMPNSTGKSIFLGEFPLGTDFKDLPEEFSHEALEKKYGPIFGRSLSGKYDTPSGELEPGCLYYDDCLPEDYYWDNLVGPHLHAILPNGNHWNIDSRASNCTLPEERTHRCWCRHGDAPNITVDKNGITCSAGAGSIQSGDYHGFLKAGEFTESI